MARYEVQGTLAPPHRVQLALTEQVVPPAARGKVDRLPAQRQQQQQQQQQQQHRRVEVAAAAAEGHMDTQGGAQAVMEAVARICCQEGASKAL